MMHPAHKQLSREHLDYLLLYISIFFQPFLSINYINNVLSPIGTRFYMELSSLQGTLDYKNCMPAFGLLFDTGRETDQHQTYCFHYILL